jgi:hypothetical protein
MKVKKDFGFTILDLRLIQRLFCINRKYEIRHRKFFLVGFTGVPLYLNRQVVFSEIGPPHKPHIPGDFLPYHLPVKDIASPRAASSANKPHWKYKQD